MSPESFTYWLAGYFEISDSNNLSPQQVQIIRDHLALVFEKVTPDRNIELHDGNNKPSVDWGELRRVLNEGRKNPEEGDTRYC